MEQRNKNQNQNQQRNKQPAAGSDNPNDPSYEKNRPFANEQKRQDSDKR